MAKGDKLINQGVSMLTAATDKIQSGIEANEAEVKKNSAKITTLNNKNNLLLTGIAEARKIVTNFNKNILGRE